jgi:hypothetical protein
MQLTGCQEIICHKRAKITSILVTMAQSYMVEDKPADLGEVQLAENQTYFKSRVSKYVAQYRI